jgi:Sulfotransferase family
MMPTFFVAGAPKAGTDLLYYQLDQHPEIYMSPLKEPNFFAKEIRPENFHPSVKAHALKMIDGTRKYLEAQSTSKRFGGIVCELSDYEKLFARVRSEIAIGEGSVSYLWSRSAPEAIARLIPNAKIAATLMDPAQRAFHQYLKSFADLDVTHSFSTHLDLAFEDRNNSSTQIGLFNPFLAFGKYADQVGRYLKHFSREQLFLSLYEDREPDYQGWFAKILEFLGVRPDFVPSPVDVHSTPRFGSRPVPQLGPEERARLVNFYRDDILRLQDRIGRNLGAWLQ